MSEFSPPKRRILMVISNLGYGGAERSFIRLANHLSRSMDVSVCTFRADYGHKDYKHDHEALHSELIILDDGFSANGRLLGKARLWNHRRRTLRRFKATHDLCISYLSGPNALNIAAGYFNKSIVTLQGSRIFDPLSRGLKQAFFRYIIDPIVYRLAASIVPVSQGLCNEVRWQAGQKAQDKCTVIAPIAPLESLSQRMMQPLPAAFAALSECEVIVSVGRLSYEKGFQNLIPVLAQLREKKQGVKLVLVGDGPLQQSLQAQCWQLQLPINCYKPDTTSVIFTGYQANPLAFIRHATLYVMSSLTEGLPNVLLEALAAQCMIIAADAPWGARAVLQHHVASNLPAYLTQSPTPVDYGVLMPRMDIAANHEIWAQTIAAYLQDEALREPFIKAGMQRVKMFDEQSVGAQWIELIERLLNDRASGQRPHSV